MGENDSSALRRRKRPVTSKDHIESDKVESSDVEIRGDVMRQLVLDGGKLRIFLLDHEDGKGAVARVAKEIAARTLGVQRDVVDVRRMEAMLNVEGLPEPQLLYVFGEVTEPLTLEGYPPWMIRVTEMWHVKGDGRVRYQDFLQGLYKFSRCVQRWGR
ncbi:hypothetical protein BC829DRAFT_251033 [Chytridium lagenaria]|nr:hypothetical protein BC829DRAFT_251033 [Chytridium lagenaria]